MTKYFVRAHTATGMSYVHSKRGKIYLSKDRSDATLFASKKSAAKLAEHLNKDCAGVSANIEKVWW